MSAGEPPICVRIAPGFHGPADTGTHGIGVSTPSAADVAAATVGFARLVHIPNGGMFMNGTMSLMVAAGLPSMNTRLIGTTFNVDGATPKLHVIIAVAVTLGGIVSTPSLSPFRARSKVLSDGRLSLRSWRRLRPTPDLSPDTISSLTVLD